MWEAIQANARRSRLLIVLMGLILLSLGGLMGATYGGGEGALLGAGGATVLWAILLAVALGGGESVLLASAKAREIKKEDAPQLWNIVEEMTIASGLGKLPRIFVIDDDSPNAFATGRNPETACVAVSSGLLKRLDRDELQGVVAHEIAHIKNWDIRFMTIASVMVGSIALLADVFMRSLWFGGGGRRSRGGGGQGQALMLVLTLAVAILGPIFAQALYFACSRRREFLADASAARFTRYPEGLASALEKISGNIRSHKKTKGIRALAPMFIVNPLQARGGSGGWFSTHPPTGRRVEILRAMGGNAGWVDYERAFKQVTGSKENCLDSQTLQAEGTLAAREASPEADRKQAAIKRANEVGDLVDRLVEFLMLSCACGVQIKVPPGFAKPTVPCPRCGRDNAVPKATESAPTESAATPLVYERKSREWESFQCACGKTHQLSPSFAAKTLGCSSCGATIEIR